MPVRALAQTPRQNAGPGRPNPLQPPLQRQRTPLCQPAIGLRENAQTGHRPPAHHPPDPDGDDCLQCLSLHRRAQGLFPATGYRADVRRYPRRPGSSRFRQMQRKMEHFIDKIREDPAIDQVSAYTGSSQSNTARMFISLKPLSERDASADEVIARLRKRLVTEPGATCFCNPCRISAWADAGQRPVPVHAARRRSERTARMDAQSL